MRWQKYFNETILGRAYDYFERGLVQDLQCCDGKLTATVAGSKPYFVSAQLDRAGHIQDFSCSCPHYESGYDCKHIAAVLFAWETEHAPDSSSTQSQPITERELILLKNRVRHITKKYLRSSNFIDYYAAQDFFREIDMLLNAETAEMLQNSQCEMAFDFANFVYEEFINAPMDDDGEIVELGESLDGLWCQIYTTNHATRNAMLEWFTIKLQDETCHWCMIDLIEDFLEKHFFEAEFYSQKLSLITEILTQIQQGLGCLQSEYTFGDQQRYVRWLLMRLNLLKQSAMPAQALEAEFLDNWQYPEIRQVYIDWLMENGRYQEAISHTKKALRFDSSNRYFADLYYHKLDLIYQITGDQAARITNLYAIMKVGIHALEAYRALKTLHQPAEWIKIRPQLIQEIHHADERAEIYASEKMYPELLECILASDGIDLLQKYDQILAKHYPEKIIQTYESLLNKSMRVAGGRLYYQKIVKILKHVKKLHGGEDLCNQLIKTWCDKYSNRRAMIEELSKIQQKP